MPSVFLSYSRLDKPVAQFLADQLMAQGIDVFIDYQKLVAGEDFVSRLGGEIEKRDHFVLIVSPRSLASDWVKSEVSWALHNKKNIIPVVIEPTSYREFFFLIRLQNIDLTSLGEHQKTDDRVISQLEKLLHALGVGKAKEISRESLVFDFPVGGEKKEFTAPSIKHGEIEDIYFSAIEQAQSDPENAVFLFSTVLNLDPNYMNGHAQELINREIEKLKSERIKKLEENLDEAIKSQNYKSIFHTATDLIELLDKNHWGKYKTLLRGCVLFFLEKEDVNLVTEICDFLQKKDYDSQFINDVTSSMNQQEKNNLIYHHVF